MKCGWPAKRRGRSVRGRQVPMTVAPSLPLPLPLPAAVAVAAVAAAVAVAAVAAVAAVGIGVGVGATAATSTAAAAGAVAAASSSGSVPAARPQCCARFAQRTAGILHRQAARGHAFVGTVVGIDRQQAHAPDRHAEAVGDDLRQRRVQPLAELDLAGAHAHFAAFAVVLDADDGHAPTRRAAAARSTARTMRLCAPQRHSCPSSAARTSASDGSGQRASSAAATTSMPELQ